MNISTYGCVDTVGNVWEWCDADESEDVPRYVLRGGSCANNDEDCNCVALRNIGDKDRRILYAGVRLVHLPKEIYSKYCEMKNKGLQCTSL